MDIIVNILINGLAVFITGYVLSGVHIRDFLTAVIVAVILGIVNTIIRPIFILLTLPINILTLGLFTFFINALLVMLVASFVPGFQVDNFGWALIFSILLSIINLFFKQLKR